MPVITILPGRTVLDVERGALLKDALQAASVFLDYPCAGRGKCRQCRVKIQPSPRNGADGLDPAARESGYRLACQVHVQTDCTVTIEPKGSVGAGSLTAWTAGIRGQDVEAPDVPLSIRRQRIQLTPPSLDDQRADWERVADALADAGIRMGPADPNAAAPLPSILRDHQWVLDVISEEGALVCLRPPRAAPPAGPAGASERVLGFAIDLGTTTVDLALLDLETGELLGRQTFLNGQVSFGADVISRAQAFHDSGHPVREAALRTIEEGANRLLRESDAPAAGVAKTVVVGNPIMIHIFHGIDPLPLTRVPFVPVFSGPIRLGARELGWTFQKDGTVETLPLVSAYVGADTVGMMVALGLEQEKGTALSVDIGTNGEMVLSRDGELLATSTAAGPAFEGAQISCGMRAREGAVASVDVSAEGELVLETLGGGPALGVCGTGLVSAVAKLRSRGLIDSTGKIVAPSSVGPLALRRHLISVNGQPAVGLSRDSRVYLSQADIRMVQLAKAAVRTGIETLLEKSGLTADGLDALRLAGSFGAGLDVNAAMLIGLIPPMDVGRVSVVGNAALRGAVMALLSRESWRRGQSAARNTRFVELGGTSEFQDRFTDSMTF